MILFRQGNHIKVTGTRVGFALLLWICILNSPGPAMAAQPLITDDIGTQGRGKWLIELNAEVSEDKDTANASGLETTIRSRGTDARAALTYGVSDALDLIVGLPYQWIKDEEGDLSMRARGFSDLFLEAKWRFYEKEGFGLALKPGLTLPTGNKEKNLGMGRPGYYLLLIATKELEPFAVHGNLGYKRNENKRDEREDIRHASAAVEYKPVNNLRFVADIGIETNPDRNSTTPPAYLLGGLIYSIGGNLDLDFGVKYGLTRTEADWTWMIGISIRL